MSRRDTLQILDAILMLLKTERELSIMQIATRTRTRWSTTREVLLFLKRHGLVTERKGKRALTHTRLSSLRYSHAWNGLSAQIIRPFVGHATR